MGRIPQPGWVSALRAVTSAEADIRFNEFVGRWEFILRAADGSPQSQFFGWFYQSMPNGQRVTLDPDPATGLYPFRELDDDAMTEVLEACIKTDLRRPGGTGSPRREAERIMAENTQRARQQRSRAASDWAERVVDRRRQMHEIPLITVPVVIGGKA